MNRLVYDKDNAVLELCRFQLGSKVEVGVVERSLLHLEVVVTLFQGCCCIVMDDKGVVHV
jgi:hypothetical protein